MVLAENPLEDIRHSESVLHVMINGRLYDAATMNEVGKRRPQAPALLLADGEVGSFLALYRGPASG